MTRTAYADRITRSMQVCLDETARRRKIQAEHNERNGITPQTVKRAIRDIRSVAGLHANEEAASPPQAADDKPDYGKKGKKRDGKGQQKPARPAEAQATDLSSPAEVARAIAALKKDMQSAAADLDFERAARLRDELRALEQLDLFMR